MVGIVSGSYGSSRALPPRLHTIQAKATWKKIIKANADQMPNGFKHFVNNLVDKLKVVLSIMKRNHMHDQVGEVSLSHLIFNFHCVM